MQLRVGRPNSHHLALSKLKCVQINLGDNVTADSVAALKSVGANLDNDVHLAATGALGSPTDFTPIGWLDAARFQAQVPAATAPDAAAVSAALATLLVSDRPDGLWATVVVDERRVSLGLAYTSAESLKEAIGRRRGVYQSRKRGLWVKGETSGTPQDLLEIEVDCDRDTLVFVVHQHGSGYCHRAGLYTCTGPRRGVELLERTLHQRLTNAPEGSYTKRLFDDSELLKSKLVEEAIELAEAVSTSEVTNEAADVLYFAMVACAKKGVAFR